MTGTMLKFSALNPIAWQFNRKAPLESARNGTQLGRRDAMRLRRRRRWRFRGGTRGEFLAKRDVHPIARSPASEV